MTQKISTMEVRERLGEYLDRVSLRHDSFVIERKGKALAAMVPVETLAELENAARTYLLAAMKPGQSSISQNAADRVATEAKHKSRRRTRR